MKLILSGLLFTIFFFSFFAKAYATSWYYPMEKYFERQGVKAYGEYVDEKYYIGKEKLFPYNRFYGYHSGVDLEIFPDELLKKVPVYAIFDSKILFIGPVSGYGNVILLKLDNDPPSLKLRRAEGATALYGHIKIKDLNLKAGDKVKSGEVFSYLGDTFSSETGKERKHLHFAIYKGTDLYFKGYENTKQKLDDKWYDPNEFLKSKGAVLLGEKTVATLISNPRIIPMKTVQNNKGILEIIVIKIINIINSIKL